MRGRHLYKQNIKILSYLFLSFTGLLVTSCFKDVPHDNPLDPALGRVFIAGRVQTYYAPHNPLADALIWLKPGNYTGRSESDGNFRIESIEAGQYIVYCSAEGYRTDSLQLDISASLSINFSLDGLPIFVKKSVTTHHVARWFPLEDVYYLTIKTQVNDPDGLADIKWVRCEVPYANYADTLNSDVEAGNFVKNIFTRDLNLTSLQEVLGHPVYVIAEDKPGAQVKSDGFYPARIIEKSADLISPVELESVTADSIHFHWGLKPLPFEYSLRIDIYAINAGIATPVESIEGISSQVSDWLFRSSLPAGDYFWTVTIRDSFGDTSQSKEGVFQIQ